MSMRKGRESSKETSKALEKAKEAVKLRESIESNRPRFVRQESWRYVRVKEAWRRPRGIDSKMRLSAKGWPASPSIGYKGPKVARGLHPSGFKEVLVSNEEQLLSIDPEREAARLSSKLGARKRERLIEKAKELGIRVLNPTGLRRIK